MSTAQQRHLEQRTRHAQARKQRVSAESNQNLARARNAFLAQQLAFNHPPMNAINRMPAHSVPA